MVFEMAVPLGCPVTVAVKVLLTVPDVAVIVAVPGPTAVTTRGGYGMYPCCCWSTSRSD
jgi:hypothetical protein